MTLRSRLAGLRTQLLSSVHIRSVSLSDQVPVVSFCFDDFPRTAWTTGGTILRHYGIRGTYYTAPGLLNTSNELGDQMTRADIDAVLSDGHEIGCHTFSHCSCRRVSPRVYENDAARGREVLHKIIGNDPGSFSYPFGHVSIVSKRDVGAKMKSARTIFPGVNGPTADLNLLRANSLYGGIDQLSKAESLLATNAKENGWLIFYTHDVRRDPSEWGCTPALLEETVELTLKMGFPVMPVGEVVESAVRSENLVRSLAISV
jgi:peptidoglycan/xylan/chitin deacetylase (PgdA/CDA1 family)